MSIINIGLHGASGRMGAAVTEAIARQSDKFDLVTKFSKHRNNYTLLDFCLASDIIIDFSSADALENLLKVSTETDKKLVIGTTGLSSTHLKEIEKASKSIAILYSPNMSIGANLVIEMAGKISRILEDYDVEIIDIHHRHKKDSPSGTAIAIGQNIAKHREQKFEEVAVFDRVNKGIRKDGDIGFSALRSGGIWGEHEVMFAGSTEVVTIGSRALSREVFANGALFAARWLSSITEPGLYLMQDIFKL